MMEIQEDIVEKLKCNQCGYYLSCSPIHLKQNGDNLCGRCTVPDDEEHLVIRNNSYETLASVMHFPCKNKTSGCLKKIPFGKVKFHEESCQYRSYNCPTTDCNWTGLHCSLKQHYEEHHGNLLLENVGNVKPDITKDSEKHYLMSAFGLLFIIHVKYIISTSKLWYCARFLGNMHFASFFECNVDITTGDSSHIKVKKTVQSENSGLLNKDNSVVINVNNLLGLGIVDNFEDVVVSVSIKLTNNKCIGCNQEMTTSLILSENGCFCEKCENKVEPINILLPSMDQSVISCKNGCSYEDTSLNLPKHEKWFCEKNKGNCNLCDSQFDCLFSHLKIYHMDVMKTYPPSNTYYANSLYKGTFICYDTLFNYEFAFSNISQKFVSTLLSDLSKSDAKYFNCVIQISNPQSKYCVTLPLKYNISSSDYDWNVDFTNDRKKSVLNVINDKKNIYTKYKLQMFISQKSVSNN